MTPRLCYRDAPRYGWPFYVARRLLRGTAAALLSAADGLSQREKYTFASHFRGPLLPANADLRDRYRGRRCFVIGNGPSLAGQDLSPLAGEVTMAMNGFVRHPLLEAIRPTFYLFADGLYFDGSGPSRQFLAEVVDRARDSTFVVPYAAAAAVRANGWLPADRTRFVAHAGNLRSAKLARVDLTRPVPAVMNTAQLGLLLAIYLGCSPVYLLGADHDWLSHRGTDGHFYAGQTLAGHPGAMHELSRSPYLDQMRDATDAWRGYAAVHAHAARRGVEIVNCTAGGFLDVFPRRRYEDVVGPPAAVRRAA